MLILAIETSCDETSVAVLENEKVLSNIISSQYFHSDYGGVVPELASREHLKYLVKITRKALEKSKKKIGQIDLVAATTEPGLIGALLIGTNFAKAIAASLEIPFVPVNHIQSHLYSSFLGGKKPEFPFISLIISGGHTMLVLVKDFFKHTILGTTVDDAAGESFDKVAKMLGLGYPGGPEIERYAVKGNPLFHKFPIPVIKNRPFHFSFSGLKTSVLYLLRDLNFEKNKNEKLIADVAASFQKTVVDYLLKTTRKSAEHHKINQICISGGVSANNCLQKKFLELEKNGYKIRIPGKIYTTDNAAMIGYTAYHKYRLSKDKKYFKHRSFAHPASPKLNTRTF